MPPFLGLNRKCFDPATYEPPTKPHEHYHTTDAKFSAFSTAATTIFWRHDPQDHSKIQSNSRIVRWSDGSLTLQLASSPKDHYRISTTSLRQSIDKKGKSDTHEYDPNRDAQVYLGVPHVEASLIQIVSPLSAAMKILPTGEQTDESVLQLQKSLAAAGATHDPFAALKQLKEDPELAKKAAEEAEKQVARARRKQQTAEEKQFTRRDRVLGHSGLGRAGGAGLSVAGLEDEDGMPTARGASKKKSKKKVNRHGDIYSDDEDEGYPRGRTREDEYDLDDGFMAASDEEPEIYDDELGEGNEEGDDPDVDDLEIEGRETILKGKTRGEGERERQETPKRAPAMTEEADATISGSPHARNKRMVIDDEDEDE